MNKSFLTTGLFDHQAFKKKLFSKSGRILGIDFGMKKIGIALTDIDQTMVFPHNIYQRVSFAHDLDYFIKLIQEYKIIALVVGVPLIDKKLGNEKLYIKIKEFFEILDKKLFVMGMQIPYCFCDESFTSQFANQYLFEYNIANKQGKKMTDKIAAAIILQEVLDILQEI